MSIIAQPVQNPESEYGFFVSIKFQFFHTSQRMRAASLHHRTPHITLGLFKNGSDAEAAAEECRHLWDTFQLSQQEVSAASMLDVPRRRIVFKEGQASGALLTLRRRFLSAYKQLASVCVAKGGDAHVCGPHMTVYG